AHGGEHGPGLVARLLLLGGRVGVGDDPRPGLHVGVPVLEHGRADGDAGVEVAGEVHVPDRPGVAPAAGGLELVDDLHGPDLRGAGDGPGGEDRPQHVDGAEVVAEGPRHRADDVHDVAVALDLHHLVDAHGADLADAAEVVAAEVHQHHVLG